MAKSPAHRAAPPPTANRIAPSSTDHPAGLLQCLDLSPCPSAGSAAPRRREEQVKLRSCSRNCSDSHLQSSSLAMHQTLQKSGKTLYGFRGGPAGIMNCKYVQLTTDFIYPYRNQGGFDMICSGRDKIETPEQFKQARDHKAARRTCANLNS